jgi:5-methylcytosine-specific restriction endonuclease McrA
LLPIVVGFAVVVVIVRLVSEYPEIFTAAGIGVGCVATVVWYLRHRRGTALARRIAALRISDNRHDYVIRNADYRRGTPRENLYRREHLLMLLELFGNCCANCGSRTKGVDLDHFVFSKNEGGSFAMFHKDGFWVNNAIPLCETCNRSKLDRAYHEFFTQERLAYLFQQNAEMTKQLNASPTFAKLRPE